MYLYIFVQHTSSNNVPSSGRDKWLVFYFLTSLSKIFLSYRHVTIAGVGLQNPGLFSALTAFVKEVICIVPHLQWDGASFFAIPFERSPNLIVYYDKQEVLGTCINGLHCTWINKHISTCLQVNSSVILQDFWNSEKFIKNCAENWVHVFAGFF